MEIKLYNTKSSNNTIGKILEDETTFNISFKDIANIQSPVIKIRSKNLLDFNYAYIPHFKRYYFIEQITVESGSLFTLYLKCDLLETYKDDILNSVGRIRAGSLGNEYLDEGYSNEINKTILVYKSNKELIEGNNVIMVALGGGTSG